MVLLLQNSDRDCLELITESLIQEIIKEMKNWHLKLNTDSFQRDLT